MPALSHTIAEYPALKQAGCPIFGAYFAPKVGIRAKHEPLSLPSPKTPSIPLAEEHSTQNAGQA
jgi:hypothetical protein